MSYRFALLIALSFLLRAGNASACSCHSEDDYLKPEYWALERAGSTTDIVHEDQLLGALSLGPDDEPDQINIGSLVVHPQHQRQGIGRSLLAAALRQGEGKVFSVSTGARNTPALNLYREFGFVVYRHGTIGPEALELVKLRASAA
jgi:ribosomal protein S18 acetylase RimI-like enzyme